MTKDWFVQKYRDIHHDLNILENEVDRHLRNKADLLGEDKKLEDLKKRIIETIDLLNKTREDERRIFNYQNS